MKELEAIWELARTLRSEVEPLCGIPNCNEPDCVEARMSIEAADRIEALLPALEKAFADLESEVPRYRGNYRGAQTEIAALREPMSCTHPRACWQPTKPDSVDAVVGYRCVACEHERLAVAAALRELSKHVPWSDGKCSCGIKYSTFDSKTPYEDWSNHILSFIPPADAKELAAHDAALWNEALEEAAQIADAEFVSYHDAANRIRALKREKRGSP